MFTDPVRMITFIWHFHMKVQTSVSDCATGSTTKQISCWMWPVEILKFPVSLTHWTFFWQRWCIHSCEEHKDCFSQGLQQTLHSCDLLINNVIYYQIISLDYTLNLNVLCSDAVIKIQSLLQTLDELFSEKFLLSLKFFTYNRSPHDPAQLGLHDWKLRFF